MAYVYNGAGAPNGARELDTSSLISHHLCSRTFLPRCSRFVPFFALAQILCFLVNSSVWKIPPARFRLLVVYNALLTRDTSTLIYTFSRPASVQ
jgi:hypothetical protein